MRQLRCRCQISLGAIILALTLSCPVTAHADPPPGRGPHLLTWNFEFLSQPFNLPVWVPARTRASDLQRFHAAVARYLVHMDQEITLWRNRINYTPNIVPFLDFVTRDGEPPAWYQRLRIFRMSEGSFLGLSPSDLNARPDGSYLVPQNRTVP